MYKISAFDIPQICRKDEICPKLSDWEEVKSRRLTSHRNLGSFYQRKIQQRIEVETIAESISEQPHSRILLAIPAISYEIPTKYIGYVLYWITLNYQKFAGVESYNSST